MTSKIELGHLSTVKLRDAWPDEPQHFTPWLAAPENLALLGEALNIELEPGSTEESVGDFSADIVCTEASSSATVLIENQLEQTDHVHIGQVLTYAAGLDAVTVVWVAKTFREEHRAALDWFNQITNDRYRFFGVEIGLVKIGDSDPAPTFTVVAKPNDWSRGIRRRAASELARSDIYGLHEKFWNQLCLHVKENNINIRLKNPTPNRWIGIEINVQGVGINAVRLVQPTLLRVESLFFGGPLHAAYFAAMDNQRSEIEAELGFQLDWEQKPTTSKFFVTTPKDPRDIDDWPAQIEWFSDMLQKFDRTFRHRIESVDPSDWSS